ncbi:MFS transporter [Cellulomonas telluris]|uniref:MFS transporter n=1 Tax=Cellulomonas telluris TaxID=2306636 RepID=UPI0010A8A3C7|nr:MFS transporter [Cellulomonas telluris]
MSRRVWVLLAAFAVSCLGTGLVLPYTAIYLVSLRGLDPAVAGAFFGLVAGASFATAPWAGRLADRTGPRVPAAAGACAQALGWTGVGFAPDEPRLAVCAVVIGVGNACFHASFTPVLAALLGPDHRKRGFSMRYLAMNVGLGIGAAAAALTVETLDGLRAFQVLYVADGLSFLPLAVALLVVAPRGGRPAADAAAAGTGYRALLRDRRLLVLLLVQTLLVLVAYSQFDTAVPLLLTERLAVAAGVVGLVVAVNTVAVVVLQPTLGRVLERLASTTVLVLCAAVWSAAMLVGLAVGLVPPGARVPVALAFAVVFALGEVCFGVGYQPLLTELAPAGLLGRASALSSVSWNVGAMAGPAIGIALVGALPTAGYWLTYAGMLALTVCVALWLRAAARPAPASPSEVLAAGAVPR